MEVIFMTVEQPSTMLTSDLIRYMSRSERLSLARTLMANQRTLLSYVTTSIGLLAAGYGLIALTGHILLQAAGVVAGVLAGIVAISGYLKYRAMRRALGKITASDLLEAGYSLLYDEAAGAS
jgi:uncharacterized membrane protein YidH (DUF202 family)